MDEREKSDSPILPTNPSNKATRAAAEVGEGRGLAEGNTDDLTRPGRSAGQGPFTIIAHCVREIFNRYSEWDGVIIQGAQEELAAATLGLAKLWPDGLEDEEVDFAAEDIDEQRIVAAAEVATKHHEGTDNNLRRALWFVGGVSAMTDRHSAALRSAKQVLRQVSFFVGYAHIAPTHQPPSQYLVRERFADFERALDLALRDALDVEDALNDVLRSANRRTDDAGEAP